MGGKGSKSKSVQRDVILKKGTKPLNEYAPQQPVVPIFNKIENTSDKNAKLDPNWKDGILKFKIAVVGQPNVGKWTIMNHCSDMYQIHGQHYQKTKIDFTYLPLQMQIQKYVIQEFILSKRWRDKE